MGRKVSRYWNNIQVWFSIEIGPRIRRCPRQLSYAIKTPKPVMIWRENNKDLNGKRLKILIQKYAYATNHAIGQFNASSSGYFVPLGVLLWHYLVGCSIWTNESGRTLTVGVTGIPKLPAKAGHYWNPVSR